MCRLSVMVVLATIAHFLSGATSKRSISTFDREGSSDGARISILLILLDLQWISISDGLETLSLRSLFRGGCVVAQVQKTGHIEGCSL